MFCPSNSVKKLQQLQKVKKQNKEKICGNYEKQVFGKPNEIYV